MTHLILMMTSSEIAQLKDSLAHIKQQLNSHSQPEAIGQLLLNESTNAIPILALTLAFPELVSSSITILLALSFINALSD